MYIDDSVPSVFVPRAAELTGLEANTLAALHGLARQSTDESREIANDAIDDLVDSMRDAGLSAARVVICIRSLAERAGIRRDIDFSQRQMLRPEDLRSESVMSGAIRRYYRNQAEQQRQRPGAHALESCGGTHE